ncbi:MAG TPA: aminotransferase class I/II-fold pyridoxal phosphate-dependent enzyme [Bacillota bacterium]|nr:aminotransferase class I/II-fold pyridoxal phosphate-dependent enzyme [Bacillota bacterium]
MSDYQQLSAAALKAEQVILEKRYQEFKARNLKLDMTRGKPASTQLDLSMGMLDDKDYQAADGTDCRNYGGVDGLPEAKNLFAEYLEVEPSEIIIGGNSSLALMHDLIVRAMLLGVPGSEPWSKLPKVKFLCPTPGYDRHFAICELFGIEMIPVELKDDGPDMEEVEKLAVSDAAIKGIWCTPKYSNPTGITYSDQVVDRLARMKTMAPDFRIFWDNAYAAHHLNGQIEPLKNILIACKNAGNPERVFIFGSTAKISFAGAGIAAVAGSCVNMNWLRKQIGIQSIGPDKINQLRHVRLFKNMAGIKTHMDKHAAILKPKFDLVTAILDSELGGKNIAFYQKPKGGYFISLDTLDGCAQKVVALAAAAGVALTKAGATFPYGKDPRDRNIRIAPSMPPLSELKQAMELVAICIQLVSIEKLTG